MKIRNTFSKIMRNLLAIVFCLVAIIAFAVPLSKTAPADAAGELTFSGYSSTKKILTTQRKDFIVYGFISNNNLELFGAEFRVNVDTSVFEIKEYLTPSQLSTELNNPSLSNSYGAYEAKNNSDIEKGYMTCAITYSPITDQSFCIGGCKIAVRKDISLKANTSSTITIDEIVIPDMIGDEAKFMQKNTNIVMNFELPIGGENLTITGYCSVSRIATNETTKEIYVYGAVSRNAFELFGAEFRINVDPSIFELKEYLKPSQLAEELDGFYLANDYYAYESKNNSNREEGYVTCAIDGSIKTSYFCIGGYKLVLKEGVKSGTKTTITMDEILIIDTFGYELDFKQVSTSINVWIVPPSN